MSTDPLQEPTAELLALAAALGRQAPPCESHPEAWYAADPSEAIERCGDCHGGAECAALAVAVDERWGVWGGQDFERRKPARDVRLILARTRPRRWAVRCTDCGREFAAATPPPAQPSCPECATPNRKDDAR